VTPCGKGFSNWDYKDFYPWLGTRAVIAFASSTKSQYAKAEKGEPPMAKRHIGISGFRANGSGCDSAAPELSARLENHVHTISNFIFRPF
jgi:hypothetical protein